MPSRKKVDSKVLFAAFIIVIMVLSTLGFFIGSASDSSDGLDYNDYKIRRNSNVYIVEYEGKDTPFYFHPSETEGLQLNGAVDSIISYGNIAVTFDPEGHDLEYIDLSRAELVPYLRSLGKAVDEGTISESEEYSLPQIDCNSSYDLIILLNSSAEPSLSKEGRCIIVEGSGRSILRYVEAIIYKMMGIVE